ncbi:MAG TPA: hypothetical protein ENN84_02990, partial [Candidatus Marinimicrobia bacterium]|nr:hypothetical protein [Candidatus Neomarinimicrobiota bacterium]
MKKLLFVMLAVMVASVAFAGWTFDSRFVNYNVDTLEHTFVGEISGTKRVCSMPHGVVLDENGKVWVGLYGSYGAHDGVHEFDYKGATSYYRPVYVYNSDGTIHKSISVFQMADGSLDTLHSQSPINGANRGMGKDADGNILVSSWSTLYRFDPETFECTGRFIPATLGSLTDAVHDPVTGFYMVGHVASNKPLHILDENLDYFGAAIDTVPSLQRSIEIKSVDDGMDLFVGGIYPGRLYKYHSPDLEFDKFVIEDTLGNYTVTEQDTSGNDIEVNYTFWASCLDWMPDGMLLGGVIRTDQYNSPKAGTWQIFDVEADEFVGEFGTPYFPEEIDWENIPDGATNSPRGATFVDANTVYIA